MSKTIENLKSGNYEVVDNQGVSVTIHFVECLEKEFSDLEVKLAETEKELGIVCVEGKDKVRENIELKQQLAEKEEMIKELSEFILEAKKGTDFLFKQDNKNLREQLAQADQDKISFCIEQLRKLEESVLDISNGYWRYFMTDGAEYMLSSDLESCLEEYIDNQIEELKKGE